jgi:CRP-like cAMP-binding protein
MNELEVYIQAFFGVTKSDLATISSYFKPVTLKKGDYFLKTGRQSNTLGFIQKGLFREYVTVGDKEITKWIASKGNFIVDLSSFVFEQPARWNIQALTDCELFIIDRVKYQKIGQEVPSWAELEKKIHYSLLFCFRRSIFTSSFYVGRRKISSNYRL